LSSVFLPGLHCENPRGLGSAPGQDPKPMALRGRIPVMAAADPASSQIAFAVAMADMIQKKTKDGDKVAKPAPKASAFDPALLARLAQQASQEPEVQEEEPAPPLDEGVVKLPPGFSLVSFETEEEANQVLQEEMETGPSKAQFCPRCYLFTEGPLACRKCGLHPDGTPGQIPALAQAVDRGYLPIEMRGTRVLIEETTNNWRVTLPAHVDEMGFRNSKNSDDRADGEGAANGSLVHGFDVGDGWIWVGSRAIKQAADPPVPTHCPAGHPLKALTTPKDACPCNVCLAKFPKGTRLHVCVTCSKAFCESCLAKAPPSQEATIPDSTFGTQPPSFAPASVPFENELSSHHVEDKTEQVGKKTEQVKSIVDNVLGAFKATANRNLKSAAVAPPAAPKALPASRAPGAIDMPPGCDIYIPPAGTVRPGGGYGYAQGSEPKEVSPFVPAYVPEKVPLPPLRPKLENVFGGVAAVQAPVAAEEKGWAEMRERRRGREEPRRKSRSGGRSVERQGQPDGSSRGARGPSPRRRSRSRRRRSRSRSRSRSKSRPAKKKRGGMGFSDNPTSDLPGGLAPGVSLELLGRRRFRMPEAYTKSLIGRGGETIQMIMHKTGSAIKVENKPGSTDGWVTIANNADKAIALIKEILEGRGCHWTTQDTQDEVGKLTNVGWNDTLDPDDVLIPTELIGLFVGNEGVRLREIRVKSGGALTIRVLPAILPGSFQVIQVAGDNWKSAREMVRTVVEDIMRMTPGRWHTPGFSAKNPTANAAANDPGAGAYAGYMAGFGATPGLSYSKEPQREGDKSMSMNVVQYEGITKPASADEKGISI